MRHKNSFFFFAKHATGDLVHHSKRKELEKFQIHYFFADHIVGVVHNHFIIEKKVRRGCNICSFRFHIQGNSGDEKVALIAIPSPYKNIKNIMCYSKTDKKEVIIII